MSLREFRFWSGGKDTADDLTSEQLDTIEQMLIELYPDGMADTQINDFFWFDRETIEEWLGIKEYPKWAAFGTPFRNDRLVEVQDEMQENALIRAAKICSVELAWYEHDDQPLFEDAIAFSGVLNAFDVANDFDGYLWEEDGDNFIQLLYLPRHWQRAVELGERSVITKDEEEEFEKFLKDFEEELNNKDEYEYHFDGESPVLRDELSYGSNGREQECLAFRIYNKD